MNLAVKTVSKTLYYTCRLLSLGYLAITAYAIFCLLSGAWMELQEGGRRFVITWPFSGTPFLLGHYNLPYILFDFLLVTAFYGWFFYLAGSVFRLFYQPRVFTENGVRQLNRFSGTNLFLPAAGWLLAAIFSSLEKEALLLVAVHFILGVFAWLLAAIFKQGVNLQGEQDLII
ncbi:DUF2975 domain-containing protein [Chitinophaga japonensis]|uniref:DUF2975 family protein n=1 Tax=Chitinophaga japonensis TaxID=104662 RepID=A0A562SZS0_CHIJA|nr:DUF2975 domain-containing protein [Chitinophaga japonensis]TWI86795.1 Protein of unknown function (DUF2975) [Chitinophaga japonensis]